MARLRKAQQDIDDRICASVAAQAESGNTTAQSMWIERSDGKVPIAVGGTDELPGIKGFAWLNTTYPTTELTTA